MGLALISAGVNVNGRCVCQSTPQAAMSHSLRRRRPHRCGVAGGEGVSGPVVEGVREDVDARWRRDDCINAPTGMRGSVVSARSGPFPLRREGVCAHCLYFAISFGHTKRLRLGCGSRERIAPCAALTRARDAPCGRLEETEHRSVSSLGDVDVRGQHVRRRGGGHAARRRR